jgi:site-specific DNA recombinase
MSAIIRAAIYARYSSDRSRDASIEDQVRVCREHADRHGWTVVEILQDAAISGASSFRPAYQTLLEHARSHRFDIVVAEALDRLSRDQSDVAGLYKQLNFAGIQISTVSEGLVNELHVGLKGTMNALFLKDLAAKTHRGLRGRVEAGKSGGGLSYGYQLVRLGASTA